MHLQTNFKAFTRHCLKLADAFQMLYIGPKKMNVDGNETTKYQDVASSSSPSAAGKKKKSHKDPVGLYQPHRSPRIRHLLTDCNVCPEEEKKKILMSISSIGRSTVQGRTPAQRKAIPAASPGTMIPIGRKGTRLVPYNSPTDLHRSWPQAAATTAQTVPASSRRSHGRLLSTVSVR